jgi:hypothetical protein
MPSTVDPLQLDTGTLALFVGQAAAALVQGQLAALGFSDLRFSHGYLFQHPVDGEPTVGERAAQLGMTQQGPPRLWRSSSTSVTASVLPMPLTPVSAVSG